MVGIGLGIGLGIGVDGSSLEDRTRFSSLAPSVLEFGELEKETLAEVDPDFFWILMALCGWD